MSRKDTALQLDSDSVSISPKKHILKSFRRKVQKSFDQNANTTNYSNNSGGMPPFKDPEKELKNITNELKSEDWQTSYEALTKLRRII